MNSKQEVLVTCMMVGQFNDDFSRQIKKAINASYFYEHQ